jgi:hypothetical protein
MMNAHLIFYVQGNTETMVKGVHTSMFSQVDSYRTRYREASQQEGQESSQLVLDRFRLFLVSRCLRLNHSKKLEEEMKQGITVEDEDLYKDKQFVPKWDWESLKKVDKTHRLKITKDQDKPFDVIGLMP